MHVHCFQEVFSSGCLDVGLMAWGDILAPERSTMSIGRQAYYHALPLPQLLWSWLCLFFACWMSHSLFHGQISCMLRYGCTYLRVLRMLHQWTIHFDQVYQPPLLGVGIWFFLGFKLPDGVSCSHHCLVTLPLSTEMTKCSWFLVFCGVLGIKVVQSHDGIVLRFPGPGIQRQILSWTCVLMLDTWNRKPQNYSIMWLHNSYY